MKANPHQPAGELRCLLPTACLRCPMEEVNYERKKNFRWIYFSSLIQQLVHSWIFYLTIHKQFLIWWNTKRETWLWKWTVDLKAGNCFRKKLKTGFFTIFRWMGSRCLFLSKWRVAGLCGTRFQHQCSKWSQQPAVSSPCIHITL